MSKRRPVTKLILLLAVVAGIVVPVTIAAAAPEKIFDLNVAPAALSPGTGRTVTATFHNATPSGNSTINSIKLQAQSPAGFKITSASGSGTEVVSADGLSVAVSGIPPVKPNKNYVLTMTVTVPAQTNCDGSGVHWIGSAWTGNSFSGDTFRFVSENSRVDQSISASCELRFVDGREPADAIKGTRITSDVGNPSGPLVQVALYAGASPASWFNGTITLAIDPSSTGDGALTSASETASGGLASFDPLSIDKSGVYRLVATGAGLTSDPSSSFAISDQSLGCDPGTNTYNVSGDAGDLGLVRQEGACDQDIPVSVIVRDKSFEVQKPFVDGSAFTMTIDWVVETAVNPVPATTIDYLDGFGPHDMQFCLGDGPDAGGFPDLPPRNDAGPGNEFWCVTNQVIDLIPSGPNAGQLQLTESYFGAGDPKFTRG